MQLYLHIPIYTNGYVQVDLHESFSKKLVRSFYYLVQHWLRPRIFLDSVVKPCSDSIHV